MKTELYVFILICVASSKVFSENYEHISQSKLMFSSSFNFFFFYMLIYFKINEKSNRNVTLQGKYEVAFLPPSSSQIELSLQIFIILNNKYF